MPEALSLTEIGTQHLELLPARTVMSIVMTAASGGTATGGGTEGTATAAPSKDPLSTLGEMPIIGKLLGGK
jgi:hypothetical protein